jgi:phosphoserine phosphatase
MLYNGEIMPLPIPEITLAQLRREVQAILRYAPPGIAVFDADGTLWAPDIANRLWRRLLHERALRSPGREAVFAAIAASSLPSSGDPHVDADELFKAYFAGQVNEELIVRVMINGLAGLSRAEVDALTHRALHQDAPPWADEAHEGMAAFVRELHAAGVTVNVVSGSPIWAVEAGLRALVLPVRQVLAGDVVQAGGWLTVDIVEPLTFRGGKGRAYDQHIGRLPMFAFGDGESDIPLFERATHLAVAVNARPSLLKALPRFGARARILTFGRTAGGRRIEPPKQDESVE